MREGYVRPAGQVIAHERPIQLISKEELLLLLHSCGVRTADIRVDNKWTIVILGECHLRSRPNLISLRGPEKPEDLLGG